MPSTHTSLHYHLIFSTKNRLPFLTDDWRARMHAYLGGIARKLNGVALAVGGVEDHVHLLVGLRATHCLSDFMRELKANSSEWAHVTMHKNDFAWQSGYCALTISPSQIEKVRRYVLNQEDHHRRMTFEDEYIKFLEQSGIEYDKRFVW